MSLLLKLKNPAVNLKDDGGFSIFSHFMDDRRLGYSHKVGKPAHGRAQAWTQASLVPGHAAIFAIPLKNSFSHAPGKKRWAWVEALKQELTHNKRVSFPFANQICSVLFWSHSNLPGFKLTVTCGKTSCLGLPGTAVFTLAQGEVTK